MAVAGTWSLGASALYSTSPYKGGDEKVLPFPVINYDGESVYLQGLSAGYYLWKDQQNQLSLTAAYSPFGFKPSDDDYGYMKQLDRRRSTVMAGLRYRFSASWGIIRTEYLGDILNESNGFTADLAYLYPFTFDRLTLLPGIGAAWASGNQNDYYFGVSQSESRRSGLNQYQADDGWSPYLEMTAVYALTDSWHASVMARYTRLNSEVKDSPMVNANSTTTVGVGLTYRF
ncbi:MipA/OmpV family protein [Sodalis sp. dw_96]|uniref:MipA/OmpV family protein n=1 Tax=Sodalis sp. dw_96 TaxID=2719794 RepID=UPI001BD3F9E6|nr:MipA/OmpV family protein [Sodalis sp. dw_96]